MLKSADLLKPKRDEDGSSQWYLNLLRILKSWKISVEKEIGSINKLYKIILGHKHTEGERGAHVTLVFERFHVPTFIGACYK